MTPEQITLLTAHWMQHGATIRRAKQEMRELEERVCCTDNEADRLTSELTSQLSRLVKTKGDMGETAASHLSYERDNLLALNTLLKRADVELLRAIQKKDRQRLFKRMVYANLLWFERVQSLLGSSVSCEYNEDGCTVNGHLFATKETP